ncbi:O-methyltransferase [Porphyromonadaceae bacterium W3.11]|nr:O-methyltransferase [Porphyromonadaceae bacterium W3.11]
MNNRLQEMALEEYISEHSSPEPEILQDLTREAYRTLIHPRMVSGHIQGRFLKFLVKMIAPKRVLELGTYIGYSALCIAEGLSEDALLTTIEVNDELEQRILDLFDKAGVSKKIELLIGDAVKILPTLPLEEFQLVYLDANKALYPEYYRILSDRMKSDSYIIADNTLWGGKLLDPKSHDPQTRGIREFNELVAHDNRMEKLLLPLRDGLTLIRIE